MALKHLIQGAGVLLAIWAGILAYNHIFISDDTLDYRLGRVAYQEMQNRPDQFGDNLVDFRMTSTGIYRMNTEGIDSADQAGKFAYNAMVVLIHAKWEMQSSRFIHTIQGYQDGELIFEVTNTSQDEPVVTLYGEFEGDEYVPSFGKLPPQIEIDNYAPSIEVNT